jgi:hypothetical protein
LLSLAITAYNEDYPRSAGLMPVFGALVSLHSHIRKVFGCVGGIPHIRGLSMRWNKVALQIMGEYLVENIDLLLTRSRSNPYQKFSTWSYEHEFGMGACIMARKKSAGSGNTQAGVKYGNGDLKWLNISLDEGDIESVLNLAQSDNELANELVRVCCTGGNFSVRYESDKNEYVCFLSDTRNDSGSNRYGLTSRAREPRHAVAAAIIKLRLYVNSPERFSVSGEGLGIR